MGRESSRKYFKQALSFDEGRILAYKMFLNKELDDDLYEYAAELLDELRFIYAKEWSEDWRNDVFLGDTFLLVRKYEEQYAAYKRAYEKANSPPPSLVLRLAGCYLSFDPPITIDEAEKLTLQAVNQELTLNGVILIRGIYATKDDQVKFDFWDKIYQELKEKNLPSIEGVWPTMLPTDVPSGGYSSPMS